ncbi:pca operon transcription factor PcaQ [Phaeobacter gallaeciensis]|uniref:pca operon transcription factor PcaQ n=1 Tax=Phaeobacter gallaeciensis TaxID=60890 RepID=UPI002380B826|nr:pca operon transcription factor PcaQ [Phaeobacter gallaeciensis]MDE4276348.1 pca operon transcription factor PcaQ [Phaeobacter gallaeciensis]MDE4301577.1 pca operon transcription factor PcaQ [Phaeobacter gallaeciensis]MDE5186732.1 pca operon transcription factor PcaQ [Phaeobacter gallaeciensis]
MRLSSQLKLRHLEVFVEVARQDSVTQAAEALGMTQPAVTRTLRELEAVVGKPLVERHGRGIRLSAYGEMFRDHAGRSLALARDGVAMLQGLDEAEGPRVAIGALPTVSATVVPDALAALRTEGSHSRFSVRTGDNQYLLDQLRRGNLDVVVGRLPAPDHMVGLDFDPLFRERVVAVVAHDHPLAALPHVPADAFEGVPVLMPSEGSIIRPLVDRMFLEQGMTVPRFPIETVSATFGRRFTLKHRAVWIISHGVVRADLEEGVLALLPLNTDSTLGPVGLCIRSEHQLSAAAARFCAALREICEG